MIHNEGRTQNVGIGTFNPIEKLDVDGAIKIGNTTSSTPGTIRWNSSINDFEGFNGTRWVSLTSTSTVSTWVNQNVTESYSPIIRLNSGAGYQGTKLGLSLTSSGNYLLAGAPGDYHPGGFSRAGSIRLLKKINGTWTPYHTIYSGNPASQAEFGYSVDMTGNNIISGSPNLGSGRAHIYTLTDTGGTVSVTIPALLTDVFGSNGDQFGYSVSITGDFASAGAPAYGADNKGRVYTYKRIGNLWVPMPALTAPDALANDRFGQSISSSGQYMAIGAPYAEVNGLTDKGKVYIYKLNQAATSWEYLTTLIEPHQEDSTYFGIEVCMRGDTLLIGQCGFHLADNVIGRVYIYVRNETGWVLQATLSAPGQSKDDSFGRSVAFEDNTIVVGAHTAVVNDIVGKGKAYVYRHDGTGWKLASSLTSSGGNEMEGYGFAVSIIGGEIMVGAPGRAGLFAPMYFPISDHGQLYMYHQ